jgi:tRNA (adenine57-N1/adenine58-N1)-methyltransferase
MAATVEVLYRTWHVEARSVRPDHRMVGHTGFLTTARLLVPEADAAPYNAKKYAADPEPDVESADQPGIDPDPI